MLGLILALPLACAPAVPTAADDPMNSKREVGPLFATLDIDQPIEEALPMFGAGLAVVFQRRFGLEASYNAIVFGRLAEFSALAVIKLLGSPVLLKAGVSHIPGWDTGDHDFDGATGFHVGASLLSGEVDDRARFRLEYTYRQLDRRGSGFSSVGLGLVLGLH